MQTPSLQGIVPALATPFKPGTSELDEPALERLISLQVSAGVQGLFALGSTGESVLLPAIWRQHVAERVLKLTAGRLPVFVHVGSQRPAEVVELAQHAEKIGAAGIAVLPPGFFSLDDTALEQFFSRVAAAVSIPVYLYNIPMNAKNVIRASLFTRLSARHQNILGLKDSSMDFGAYLDFLQAKRPDQSVMMGNDSQILAGLLMGGQGAVSAGATAMPEPYVELWRAFRSGDMNRARHWQSVCTMVRSMFVKAYAIAPIKRVLSLRGISAPDVAPPLRQLSAEEDAQLQKDYAAVVKKIQAGCPENADVPSAE